MLKASRASGSITSSRKLVLVYGVCRRFRGADDKGARDWGAVAATHYVLGPMELSAGSLWESRRTRNARRMVMREW